MQALLAQRLLPSWTVILVIVLHAILAVGTDLSPDEAHYALYATHLDWSYYDHPPMVGWVQWPFVWAGSSDFLLRMAPMFAWLVALWTLVQLVDALYPTLHQTTLWCCRPDVLLFCLSPMLFLLGLAWVPDSMLMLLTCRVMCVTWRLTRASDTKPLALWGELGIYLGLAGLSKYTAVVLAFGVVFTLWWAYRRRLFTQKGAWLALALALLCVTPVVLWNAANDWASFHFQFSHAKGSSGWHLKRVLIYLLVVVLVYGVGLPWWVWQGTRCVVQFF